MLHAFIVRSVYHLSDIFANNSIIIFRGCFSAWLMLATVSVVVQGCSKNELGASLFKHEIGIEDGGDVRKHVSISVGAARREFTEMVIFEDGMVTHQWCVQ